MNDYPDTLYVYIDKDGYADGITDKPDFMREFYAVPYTATGETWSLGIQRIWLVYHPDDPKTIACAFGTKDDMDSFVAESGWTDTGRMMLNWDYR